MASFQKHYGYGTKTKIYLGQAFDYVDADSFKCNHFERIWYWGLAVAVPLLALAVATERSSKKNHYNSIKEL